MELKAFFVIEGQFLDLETHIKHYFVDPETGAWSKLKNFNQNQLNPWPQLDFREDFISNAFYVWNP